MRILHIGKYFEPFTGGIEVVTRDLARSAADQGYSVAVLCHDHKQLRGSKTWLCHKVKVYRAMTLFRMVFTPVSCVFPFLLRRELKNEPTIIHVHMPNPSAFWLLLFRLCGAKVVIHWHADVEDESSTLGLRLMYGLYLPLERALLRRASAIICTSPQYSTHSKALKPWRDKITVIPLGINLKSFAPGEDCELGGLGVPEDVLKVLTVARLSFFKGHRHLAHAVANLINQGVAVQWTIVGEGDEKANLLKLIRELDLARHVRFLGELRGKDLVRCFNQCDVFCLPSINRMESFGIVLLEAMALGKPCIVTNAEGSGMSHVVKDGFNGRVVARADAAALSDALIEAARYPRQWRQMGLNAARYVRENFTNTVVAEQLHSLYDRITDIQKS